MRFSPGVYKICDATGRVLYVGSTSDMKQRFRAHRASLRRGDHPNRLLQAAYNEPGSRPFLLQAVEVVAPDSLLAAEKLWIVQLEPTCNLRMPGRQFCGVSPW